MLQPGVRTRAVLLVLRQQQMDAQAQGAVLLKTGSAWLGDVNLHAQVSVCASTTFQDSTEQHDLCRTAKSLKVSQFYSRRWRRRGLDINIGALSVPCMPGCRSPLLMVPGIPGPCGCGFTGLPTFDELETFTAASAVTAGQSQVESTGVPVAVVAGGAAVMVTIIIGTALCGVCGQCCVILIAVGQA